MCLLGFSQKIVLFKRIVAIVVNKHCVFSLVFCIFLKYRNFQYIFFYLFWNRHFKIILLPLQLFNIPEAHVATYYTCNHITSTGVLTINWIAGSIICSSVSQEIHDLLILIWVDYFLILHRLTFNNYNIITNLVS